MAAMAAMARVARVTGDMRSMRSAIPQQGRDCAGFMDPGHRRSPTLLWWDNISLQKTIHALSPTTFELTVSINYGIVFLNNFGTRMQIQPI